MTERNIVDWQHHGVDWTVTVYVKLFGCHKTVLHGARLYLAPTVASQRTRRRITQRTKVQILKAKLTEVNYRGIKMCIVVSSYEHSANTPKYSTSLQHTGLQRLSNQVASVKTASDCYESSIFFHWPSSSKFALNSSLSLNISLHIMLFYTILWNISNQKLTFMFHNTLEVWWNIT